MNLKIKRELPWPEDVWTRTLGETGKLMREQLGDNATNSCSGVLMRHGWQCCERAIRDALAEQGIKLEVENREHPFQQEKQP